MNINFQSSIPNNFNNHSRVWIYQSNRAFTGTEILQIEEYLSNRIKRSKFQDISVRSYASLMFGQFIIIMVDQIETDVSSFNTDNLMGLIKEIEQNFQVTLFDRQILAFIIQDRIQLLPLTMINKVIEKDMITPETLYFNNTVLTKKELLKNWIIPVKDSWLRQRILEETQA